MKLSSPTRKLLKPSLLLIFLVGAACAFSEASYAGVLKSCAFYLGLTPQPSAQQHQLKQAQIDEMFRTVNMTEEQEEVLLHAKEVLRFDTFVERERALAHRSNSYLLGPEGNDYWALKKCAALKDFWDAFDDTELSASVIQTENYVTRFLKKLIFNENNRVIYFVPDDLTAQTKSTLEFKILTKHKRLLSKVTFVYGPRGLHTKLDCD